MSQLSAIQDPLLSGVSSAYIPPGLIAEQILPQIKSATDSGKLAKYGKSHVRLELNFKAGRGEYRRAEAITRSTTGFQIEGHGLEGMVTKSDYRNVQDPYDAEKDETMGITTLLAIEKEYLVAAALTDTAVLTQTATLAGNQQYSDYLNSDPIADFSTARATMIGNCGFTPNVAIMDILVWNKLRFHPQMLDFLGYKMSRPGGLSVDELAEAMGVKKILVAEGRYNSAKEGQTDAFTALWGKDIVFALLPEKAVPYQASLGYLVVPDDSTPRKVTKYAVNNPPGSTGILCEDEYDILLSDITCGYLLKAVIA